MPSGTAPGQHHRITQANDKKRQAKWRLIIACHKQTTTPQLAAETNDPQDCRGTGALNKAANLRRGLMLGL